MIVTLSLMILLTVIAVGLLSLSSIALRSSSRGEASAIARSNAKLALAFALADLQRQMGPDSRISAPSDAGAAATGGSPHWTGVYDAWSLPQSGAAETPSSRAPAFRGWLVSGTDPATGIPAPGGAARILMLGSGTLGDSAQADDEVRVSSQKVTGNGQSGNLAWWTADEGIKAKVNAGPDPGGIASFGKADPLFQSQSPPNVGQKAVEALSSFDWKPGKRALAVSTGTLNLAAGLAANGIGPAIHDVTVHSAGVLTDVRAGRLKRDLTNILSRPITELENKPLYVADGHINRFQIGADGSLANGPGIPSSWQSGYNKAGHWGINLEELGLFHSLPRDLVWSGGNPSLVMKSTREAAVADRHFLYKRPATQVMQFLFSLEAVPDTGRGVPAGRYKMEMHMDAMIALWNPNDIPLVYPPGLELPFQLYSLPYDLKWNIKRSSGTSITSTFTSPSLQVFKGLVGGGAGGQAVSGFTLAPGEAAVFGSGIASGFTLNLSRGFFPSGGVALTNWNLKADNLQPSDVVDFECIRSPRLVSNLYWTYFNTWIGSRDVTAAYQMDSSLLTDIPNASNDQDLPPVIYPPQALAVSEFIDKPKPFLMLSFLQNVEKSSGANPPDAFASRPYQLSEPAVNERSFRFSRANIDRHSVQLLCTAEPLNFRFKSLAAGNQGRNIYIGGGRQPNLDGWTSMISRRIPLAPPLSLGALQNAIASGFSDHFNETAARTQVGGNALITNGSFPSSAASLSGHLSALPLVSKAIGNSQMLPQLAPGEVYKNSANVTVAARGTSGNVATDHSWMANTALWDSWFLSGIADGTGAGNSAWQTDDRSPRDQLSEFAKGEKPLRNTRFIFHPHKPVDEALSELFNGNALKESAVNQLSEYLLVDGAFNVNSTSVAAWKAILSSIAGQELLEPGGGTTAFDHPLGTLGYAASQADSGAEGDWTGLRDLDDGEIESLATAIVTEVKQRGPFLSLADFVNRRPDSSDSTHQSLGALQAAIDKSGLNSRMTGGSRDISAADFNGLPGAAAIADSPAPARAVGSQGHLSQGDLLTAIGSQISVRSDTFVIRAYGDSTDGVKVTARAWCEAVVQRLPEFLDPADEPGAQDGWPTTSSSLLPANARFGRRFVIRSFRWLAPSEI